MCVTVFIYPKVSPFPTETTHRTEEGEFGGELRVLEVLLKGVKLEQASLIFRKMCPAK